MKMKHYNWLDANSVLRGFIVLNEKQLKPNIRKRKEYFL